MTKIEAKKYKFLRALVASLLVVIMAGAVVLGVGFGVYGKDTSLWFKPKQDASQGEEQQPDQQPEDPTVIEAVTENGIKLMSGMATTAADGTTSKVLTATVDPATAANVGYVWSVAFKNASSEWATGKNVTDYVTVTQDENNELKATVTCKKAFGEQILVTIKSKYTSASASCSVDYMKRVEKVTLKINMKDHGVADHLYATLEQGQSYPDLYFIGTNDGHVDQPPQYKFQLEVTYSDGTKTGDIELRSYQAGVGTSSCDLLDGIEGGNGYVTFDELLHGNGGEIGDIALRVMYNNEKIVEWSPIKVIESASSITIDITEIVF